MPEDKKYPIRTYSLSLTTHRLADTLELIECDGFKIEDGQYIFSKDNVIFRTIYAAFVRTCDLVEESSLEKTFRRAQEAEDA